MSPSLLTAVWRREFVGPHTRFRVKTEDEVALCGAHFKSGHDTVVVYCHGFLSGKNYLAVPRFVEGLAESADVIAFDFRGHGESGGASTLGECELLDLDAVLRYAGNFGYRRVLLVGSSMGGAVAIRYAAQSSGVAGVATIGAFAHGEFGLIASRAVEFFRFPLTHELVRIARQARVASVRLRSNPVEVVHRISPRPLLLIHGQLDPLIPPSHARALYARAGEPKKLIVIPRGSHDIPNLNRRTKDWIVEWMKASEAVSARGSVGAWE